MDWQPLLEAASRARENAYAPYSDFRVGAALLMRDGTVVRGCNVENQTYGLTVCAERVAMQTAICLGLREVAAVAVITDTAPPSPPCGQCLSVLAEFAGPDLPVLLAGLDGDRREYTLGQLLPVPFQLPGRGGD